MLEYFIYHYGTQIIAAILCAIFGCLGYAIKKLAVKYINDDTKRAIARVAVQFVEQVWNTLHGADKLAKALETAEALLKNGATSVTAYITHGVLSGGAVTRISSSKLKELVITDSIQPTTAVLSAPNIRVVSTDALLGEAISRTAQEQSVSSLFN